MKFTASRCLIIHNEDCCQDCGAFGRVHGLILPHDTVIESEAPDEPADCEGYALSLSYITEIVPVLWDRLSSLGAIIRMSMSRTAGMEYLANRCPHCDALRGDYFLWKPEGPFWTFDDAPKPAFELVAEPVWICALQWGDVPIDLAPYGDFEPPAEPRRRAKAKLSRTPG